MTCLLRWSLAECDINGLETNKDKVQRIDIILRNMSGQLEFGNTQLHIPISNRFELRNFFDSKLNQLYFQVASMGSILLWINRGTQALNFTTTRALSPWY